MKFSDEVFKFSGKHCYETGTCQTCPPMFTGGECHMSAAGIDRNTICPKCGDGYTIGFVPHVCKTCTHTHENQYGKRTVTSSCGQRFDDISPLMASNESCPNCGKTVFNEYK